MEKLTVLILDDAAIVRSLTIDLLRESAITAPLIGTFLEADDTSSAIQLIAQYHPHIAILDIKVPASFPLRNGIDLLKMIRRSYPATEAGMLTNHATSQYRSECIRLGAAFFLDKSVEFDQLPVVIEALASRLEEGKLAKDSPSCQTTADNSARG